MRGLKKCFFTVTYNRGEVGRFSSLHDAMSFAQTQSRLSGWAEVRHKTGIIGQYDNGAPTPEFAQHHQDHLGHEHLKIAS